MQPIATLHLTPLKQKNRRTLCQQLYVKTVFIFVLFFLSRTAFAQQDCNAYREVLAAFKLQGWSVTENKYCNISQTGTCSFSHAFSKDLTYRICAFTCDDDVLDIDLYLYESDESLYTKDVSYGSVAKIDFSPYTGRQMKIIAKNQKSNTPNYNSCVTILVLYK